MGEQVEIEANNNKNRILFAFCFPNHSCIFSILSAKLKYYIIIKYRCKVFNGKLIKKTGVDACLPPMLMILSGKTNYRIDDFFINMTQPATQNR